jgi:2-polyprenyl-6-methoxyphenol hydroxylase-like FAD-dependent oxidoreductase
MPERRQAEVAGGGFAGLMAATALAQRGWSVRLHERAAELRAFGAGIWIWENGLRVLDGVGARADVVEDAHHPVVWERRDGRGKLIDRVELSGADGGVICVEREQLHRSLRRAAEIAGVEVVTRSEAVSADPAGALLLASGKRLSADLVVAADGVRSRIRESLHLVQRHRQHDEGAIRLLLPPVARGEEGLPASDVPKVIEWWGGERNVLYTPCGNGIVYLCMSARCRDASARRIPVDKPAWSHTFPYLESLFDRIEDQGRWDRFETLAIKRWSMGKVAVVGDAAHSMTPGLGQGAGMAMTNALALAVAVDGAPGGRLEEALAAWEISRRPMTEHTQRWSLTWPLLGWPPYLAHLVFGRLPVASAWILRQRMRTAAERPEFLAAAR